MSPDAARLRRGGWPCVMLSVLGAACAASATAPGQGSPQPPSTNVSGGAEASEPVEALAGIELGELTDSERELWIDLVNTELSPCGEPVAVGRCAQAGGRCGRCMGAARYLVRLVMEGFDRAGIEEQYEGRFGPEGDVDLALEGAPARGPEDAHVTIVIFSDFECPHCSKAHGALAKVIETHRDVRLVFKHSPLMQHPRALPAARAAEAARHQGRFWEMHDKLFENQRALEDADLERYATEVGLDLARFRSDLGSAEVQARIDADLREGARVGVRGTPTLFVDRRRFGESLQALDAYVQEALIR